MNQKQWTRKRLELLGFIFQDRQLLPDTRIGDQLELVAKLKGERDKAARQAEVRSPMEDLGIEASYAKYPRQMSGGQKQRAAIVRAFIGNPQLILADEPTASLDPDRGQEIAQLIRKEVKSKNKSAIMVTHDRSILPYVDTIYELTHGTLTSLYAWERRVLHAQRSGDIGENRCNSYSYLMSDKSHSQTPQEHRNRTIRSDAPTLHNPTAQPC